MFLKVLYYEDMKLTCVSYKKYRKFSILTCILIYDGLLTKKKKTKKQSKNKQKRQKEKKQKKQKTKTKHPKVNDKDDDHHHQ